MRTRARSARVAEVPRHFKRSGRAFSSVGEKGPFFRRRGATQGRIAPGIAPEAAEAPFEAGRTPVKIKDERRLGMALPAAQPGAVALA